MRKLSGIMIPLLIILMVSALPASAAYKKSSELVSEFARITLSNKHAKLVKIGKSAGGEDLYVFEIVKSKDNPAVLLVANMEGDSPVATEAALFVARKLVKDWASELDNYSFYIIPLGNPDGYKRMFDKPIVENFGNNRKINDDMDDRTDEDGPEDLNKDGFITIMRQKHPEGKWIPVEGNPVLMKKADTSKGEKGIYRLFTEGVDNDRDGKYNEDGPGGTNPGNNFPHEFKYHTSTYGPWPASETETRAVLQYAFDHPEIAMIISFSRLNTLRSLPPSDKKSSAGKDKYKVPERMAKRMGLDPDKEWPIKELVQIARDITGYKELTEDMVLQFLGVGAALNPDKNDVPYWEELSKQYKEFIKKAALDGKRLDSKKIPPGSVEEWGYFQYGVPTFAIDFWTVPVKEEKKAEDGLTADKIEAMTDEEFIALGKEKIQAFIDKSGRKGFNADMVINAIKSGMLSTKKIAEMMRKMEGAKSAEGADAEEKALFEFNKDAFVPWKAYKHPALGEVEIGGVKPFSFINPPEDQVDELVSKQAPFIRELVKALPAIDIAKVETTEVGDDVWRVKAWIVNNGFLPFPTYQGKRCKRPAPLVAEIKGQGVKLLEGYKRKPLGQVKGSGGYVEVSWLIGADEGDSVEIKVGAAAVNDVKKVITLKSGGAK